MKKYIFKLIAFTVLIFNTHTLVTMQPTRIYNLINIAKKKIINDFINMSLQGIINMDNTILGEIPKEEFAQNIELKNAVKQEYLSKNLTLLLDIMISDHSDKMTFFFDNTPINDMSINFLIYMLEKCPYINQRKLIKSEKLLEIMQANLIFESDINNNDSEKKKSCYLRLFLNTIIKLDILSATCFINELPKDVFEKIKLPTITYILNNINFEYRLPFEKIKNIKALQAEFFKERISEKLRLFLQSLAASIQHKVSIGELLEVIPEEDLKKIKLSLLADMAREISSLWGYIARVKLAYKSNYTIPVLCSITEEEIFFKIPAIQEALVAQGESYDLLFILRQMKSPHGIFKHLENNALAKVPLNKLLYFPNDFCMIPPKILLKIESFRKSLLKKGMQRNDAFDDIFKALSLRQKKQLIGYYKIPIRIKFGRKINKFPETHSFSTNKETDKIKPIFHPEVVNTQKTLSQNIFNPETPLAKIVSYIKNNHQTLHGIKPSYLWQSQALNEALKAEKLSRDTEKILRAMSAEQIRQLPDTVSEKARKYLIRNNRDAIKYVNKNAEESKQIELDIKF